MSQIGDDRFKLLSASDLAHLRRQLIEKEVRDDRRTAPSERQMNFADHVVDDDPSSFLDWFQNVGTDEIEVAMTLPPDDHAFTTKEISEPPFSTELAHYQRLKDLEPRFAASSAFWTTYQLELVRRDMIKPSYFAARPGGTESGKARLEKARLSYVKRKKVKPLDDCVRTILRQLGGLREARGNVSIFVDCRMARAWWRGYIANHAHQDVGVSLDRAWQILRLASAPWDEMMYYSVKRLTSMNYRTVRSGFIAYLNGRDIDEIPSDDRKSITKEIMQRIGVLSANRLLGALTAEEIHELLDNNY